MELLCHPELQPGSPGLALLFHLIQSPPITSNRVQPYICCPEQLSTVLHSLQLEADCCSSCDFNKAEDWLAKFGRLDVISAAGIDLQPCVC